MSAMLADTRPDKATVVGETPRPERKRVVIVGGGFAGIAAAHARRPVPEGRGRTWSVRRRRRGVRRAKRTPGARSGAGGDSGRAVCGAADRGRAEGAGGQTSVPLFRQGQHGRRRQELRGAGAGLAAHKRLPDVAGVGIHSYPLPSAAAESAARTAPVGMVLFHRPAQLAPYSRAAAHAGYGGEVTDVCGSTVCPSLSRSFGSTHQGIMPKVPRGRFGCFGDQLWNGCVR